MLQKNIPPGLLKTSDGATCGSPSSVDNTTRVITSHLQRLITACFAKNNWRFVGLFMVAFFLTLNSFAQFTTTSSFNNPYCIGASNGSVTLTASAGVAPYTVQQTSPSTGSVITMTGSPATYTYTGLVAAVYSFKITDANGSVVNRNITLTNPTPFSFTNFAFITYRGAATCDSIDLSFTNYTNGGTNRPNYRTEFWINVPTSNTNGSVPSSNPTITYNRTTGGGTFRIPRTSANTYTVARVTDSCGNTIASNINTLPSVTGLVTKSTTGCGIFDVEATYNGLSVPITFTLDSNGVTKKTLIQNSYVITSGGGSLSGGKILSVPPGAYTLNAVDACGQTVSMAFTITNPAKPRLQSQITLFGCNANVSVDSTSSLSIKTSSYNQPYTLTFLSGPASYNHTNTAGVLQTNFTYPFSIINGGTEITNIPIGNYRIALTDNCGFTDTATFTISTTSIQKINMTAVVTPGCLDANTVSVTGSFNCSRPETGIGLYNSAGVRLNSTGVLSNPITFTTNNLPSGNYTIRLFGTRTNYLGNGGTSFIEHIYTGGPSAVIPVSFAPYTGPTINIILKSPCPNSTIGSLVAKAVGVPPYSFELLAPLTNTVLRTSQTDSVFNNVNLSDSFRIRVTDGCGNVSVSRIASFAGVPRDITVNNNSSVVSCVAIGGTATFVADSIDAFTYRWTGPNGFTANGRIVNKTITSITDAGTYKVVGTNVAGCKDSATIVLTTKANAGADQTVSCYYSGTATMAATGSGTWVAQTGNPGTATITTPASPTTTITGFSAAGIYKFIFTSTTTGCKDTAIVVANASCSGCFVANNIISTTTDNFCGTANGVTITGTQPTPTGGVYKWMRATNGGNFVTAPGTSNAANYTTGSLSAGVYDYIRIYSVSSPTTCSDTSFPVTITVNALPGALAQNISLNGGPYIGLDSVAVCPGNDAILDFTSTYPGWTFKYYNPSGILVTAGQGTGGNIDTYTLNNISKADSGVWTVIYTNPTGCSDTAIFKVNVKTTTPPLLQNTRVNNGAYIGGNTATLCPGNTLYLDFTSNYLGWTFEYYNPSNVLVTTGQGVGLNVDLLTINNISRADSGIWNVYYANPDGCTNNAIFNVKVVPLPVIAPITGITSVCVGSTTQLSSTTTGGVWKSLAPSIATVNSSTGLVTALDAGTCEIIYIVTNSIGCADTVSTIVTVKPLPSIGNQNTFTGSRFVAGNTCTICTGSTFILDFQGNYSSPWNFVYKNPMGMVVASTPNPDQVTRTNASASDSGEWRVDYTGPNGCSSSATFNVNVVPLPSIAPITGSTSVCEGKSTTLASTTLGGVWKSVTPSVASINTSGVITGVTVGTSVIRYTVTNANGCVDSVSKTITVNSKPDAGADKAAACYLTSSATMGATGTGTWSAASGNPGTAIIAAPTSATTDISSFSAAGTYNFVFTNASGCTDTASIVVGSTCTCPIAANTILTPSTAVCTPFTGITINGSTATPNTVTYQWQVSINNSAFANVASSGTGEDYSTGTLSSGIYKFRRLVNYVGTPSCSRYSDTLTLTVNPKPSAGSNVTVECGSSTSTVSVTGSPVGGTWSSLGTNPLGASIGATASGVATVSLPTAPTQGTWSFVYTLPTGCSDTMTVTIGVSGNPAPVVNSGTNPICVNGIAQLCPSNWGWSNYQWYKNGVAMAAPIGTASCLTLGSADIGSYTVTGQNSAGCWSRQSTPIVVSYNANCTAPVPSVCNMQAAIGVNSVAQCVTNNNYQFSSTVTGGTAPYTYYWDFNDGTYGTTANPSHVYATSGEHDVTLIVRDANGCEAHASTVQIYIGAKPMASFAVYGNSGSGNGVSFSSTSSIAGGWIASYQWNLGNGTTATGQNPGPIVYDSGRYTITLITTGNFGCKDTSVQVITVDNGNVCTANSSFTIKDSTIQCLVGNNFKFKAYTDTTANYVWNFGDGSATSTASAPSKTYAAAGTYVVRLFASNACGSTTTEKVVTVIAPPSALTAITGNKPIRVGDSTQLSNSTSGGVWSSSNAAVATINPSTGYVKGLSVGTTTITYRVTTACGSVTTTQVITVKAPCVATSSTTNITVCASAIPYTWNGTSYFGAGTYSKTLVNASGCDSIATLVLVVSQGPAMPSAISGTTNIVAGTTATLSSATAGGVWSSANSNVATVNPSTGVVTGVSAGTVVISYTVTNSCGSSSASATITVRSNCIVPTANFTVNNATQCFSTNNFVFNNTSTGTANNYTWNFGDGSSSTTNNTRSYVAPGSYTVTLVAANACGSDSKSIIVTVGDTLATPIVSGNATVLKNTTTTLTSNILGGVWTSSNTAVATVNASTGVVTGIAAGTVTISYKVTTSCDTAIGTLSVRVLNCLPNGSTTNVTVCSSALPYTWNGTAYNAAGTYSKTFTNAAGCDSIATLVLTTSSGPAQPAAISGSVGIVVGNSTTLSSATAGGSWSSSNIAVATINSSTGVVTGVSAGTVTITYTVTNSCGSALRTQVITVSAACVTTTSSTSVTVCSNSLPYFWNGTAYNAAGTYKDTLINTLGCDSIATLVLTVSAAPVQPAVITGANNLVVGNTTTYTNSVTGGVWSSANTNVATVNPSTGLVTAVAPGTVVISYTTSSAGCASLSASKTLTVASGCVTPVADFSVNNATQCLSGNSFNFTNSTTGTVSGYTWNFGDGSSTVANPTHVYTAAGTYTVTLTATSACGSSSKTASITVSNGPVQPVISGSASIIVGNTTTLTGTPSGGVWSSSNTAVATVNQSTGVVTGVAAGNATITYMVTNSCGTVSTTKPVSITSCTLQASFTINKATQCVTNNSFMYNSNVTGGVAPYTYAWNFHDGSTATTANPTKVYATYGEGNVQLQVTDNNGCLVTATPKYEVVGAKPTASFSVIDNTGTGTSKTFISASTIPAGSMSYAWNFSNGQTSTLINPTIGFAPGNYIVTLVVTGSGGCTDTTRQSITQTIANSVSIYPNPVIGQVEVSFRSASVTPTTVQILDLSGRLIQTQTLTPAYTGQLVNATFNIGGLQSGSYVIKIIDQQNGVLVTKTLLKQ